MKLEMESYVNAEVRARTELRMEVTIGRSQRGRFNSLVYRVLLVKI